MIHSMIHSFIVQAKMTPKAFIHKIHEICRADLQNIVLPEVREGGGRGG